MRFYSEVVYKNSIALLPTICANRYEFGIKFPLLKAFSVGIYFWHWRLNIGVCWAIKFKKEKGLVWHFDKKGKAEPNTNDAIF